MVDLAEAAALGLSRREALELLAAADADARAAAARREQRHFEARAPPPLEQNVGRREA